MKQILIVINIFLVSCNFDKNDEIVYNDFLKDLEIDSLISENEQLFLDSVKKGIRSKDSLFFRLRQASVVDFPRDFQKELLDKKATVLEASMKSMLPSAQGPVFINFNDEESIEIVDKTKKFVSLLRKHELISDDYFNKILKGISDEEIIFKIDVLNTLEKPTH